MSVVEVRLDREGDIDEVVADASRFHLERMEDWVFWFAVGDQHFLIGPYEGGGGIGVVHNGDASPDLNKGAEVLVDLPVLNAAGETTAVYQARPCPNPECSNPVALHWNYDFVRCKGCGMAGPENPGYPEKNLEAWNGLPRWILWTKQHDGEMPDEIPLEAADDDG
jgi:hypothetical protein